jgi:hypothetical protein
MSLNDAQQSAALSAAVRPKCGQRGRVTTLIRSAVHCQGHVDANAARNPLLRRSFHAAGQPACAQMGGRSQWPWVTADDCSFPPVLARMWHDAGIPRRARLAALEAVGGEGVGLMSDTNKRNLVYFENPSMRGLYASMDEWQQTNNRRLMSVSVQRDGDNYCCIALTNPTEVVITSLDGKSHVKVRDDKIWCYASPYA